MAARRNVIYAASANLESTAAHNVHIVRMCEALTQRGEKVILVAKHGPPWEKLADYFELTDRFEIRAADPSGAKRFAAAQFAAAVLRTSRAGDLILTRDLPAALLTAMFGRDTILELHAPFDARRSRVMFRMLLRMKRFIGLVVITKALEEHFLLEFGKRLQGRTIVLPDGANFRPATRGEKPEVRSPSIGYVGAFYRGKGVDLVLRIARAMPEAHFYLVGGHAADADIADHEVPDNAHFVGRVSHREATSWIDAFDIVLLPNSTKVLVSGGTVDIGRWTSPLKLFEYMAAGRPMVASRLSVLEEVLEDGRNCLLADPNDVTEWVRKIRLLVDNPDRAASLGATAREDFANNYSWLRRAERLIAFAVNRRRRKKGNRADGLRPESP